MATPSFPGRASLARVLALAAALAPLFSAAPAAALSRIGLPMEETVRRSDAVFVGRVLSRESRWADETKRWMWTDVTLQVEDGISGAKTGDTVTVRYWGGQIGDEAMGVSGLKIPLANERFVMLLKPESAAPRLSPVVGETDGLFRVVDSAAGPVVTTAEGGPVSLPAAVAQGGETPVGAAQAAPAPSGPLSLADFTAWLRDNSDALRARPAPAQPAGMLPVERVYPGQPLPEEPGAPAAHSPVVAPAAGAAPADLPPPPPDAPTPAAALATAGQMPNRPGGVSTLFNLFSVGASLPIVFNPLPPSMSTWAGVDQQQMGKWNYYADVFRVLTTPTGTFGWNNGRFDMCGFPSSATMQSQFGAPWDSDTLGICYWRSANGVLVEADVSLNPAWSWTLNDEWVFGGGNAWSFRNVMLHELGHAWGLDHNFTDYSVMNYVTQEVGPLLTLPMMDDAEAIRRRYPSATRSVGDVAIYLVDKGSPASDGKYQWWTESSFPFSARAGQSFNISQFRMENVGTETKNVVVDWYLTPARNFSGAYRYLRTMDYGALNRFYYFNPTTTSVTVPQDIAEGMYYVGALIRDDGGATQSDFPTSNNRAFTRRTITIQQRLSGVSVDQPNLKPGQSTVVMVYLHGASGGARVTPAASPTAPLTYPFSFTIPAGSTGAGFIVTAQATDVPVTIPFKVSYGGETVQANIYVVPDPTMGDVKKALDAVAGRRALTAAEADFLNVVRTGTSASVVDLQDVTRLTRIVNGLG